MFKILILGGTLDARQLTSRLAGQPVLEVTVSLAGRTSEPVGYDANVISGGFGGAAGLADYLTGHCIDLLIDATHPFAENMSFHAAEAASLSHVQVFALHRPPWIKVAGDNWIEVDSHPEAIAALGDKPARVFLAIGRQEAGRYMEARQHFYLIRSVEPVDGIAGFDHVRTVLARGPFDLAGELDLLTTSRIEVIVTKNAGGEATYAKIAAARALGLPVIMIGRPHAPDMKTVANMDEAVERIKTLAGY